MKQTSIYFILAPLMLLISGCRHGEKDFSTTLREDSRLMTLTSEEEYWPDGNTIGVNNCYSLVWPTEAMLTPEAEQELLLRCFGDSNATTFEQAADRWLNNTWIYEDDFNSIQKKVVDSLPESMMYNYAKLESKFTIDREIGTFSIWEEASSVGAAHGIYYSRHVNIDLNTRKIIHLSDLMDTTELGEIIAHAVENLVVNKNVHDCLLEENPERLPIPEDFIIDSTRSTITLVYQLYEIASYADGIQSVILPIFWLSKHTPLTPYAKELFGEGSSL